MLKQFIETFRKPSAHLLARRELEDAQRELLLSQTSAEYASRMASYNADRIRRLTAFLKEAV
jgi:hypothetical protein